MRKRSFFLAVGACLATLTLTVGSAVADPSGPPQFRELAGTGADGPQGVMNGLSQAITIGGTKVIGSYDAVGSAQITTKDPAVNPNCTINRPGSGGAGINALVASQTAGDGCLQFARQVTNDSASRAGQNLTYIPYAVDALAYVIRDDSTLLRNLSIPQLTAIYNCQLPGVKPLLGPFGAGTRRFFLQQLGFTDAANFVTQPNHTCIQDGVSENRGIVLTDPGHIAPHSIAQYLSQANAIVPDVRGRTLLGSINGINPSVLNNSSAMLRDVYNVVPTGQIGPGTTTNTVFVGPGSSVCTNPETIRRFGFNTNANCGSTLIQTP